MNTEALTLEQEEFGLLSAECRLHVIQDVATRARKAHSVQGHHCELRKAIDAICAHSKLDWDRIFEAGREYRTRELAQVVESRRKAEEALALASQLTEALRQARAERDALREALQALAERVESRGNWDDGCFYLMQFSAPELESPLRQAARLLNGTKPEGSK